MNQEEFYGRLDMCAELGLIERLSNGIELLGYRCRSGREYKCDTEDYSYIEAPDGTFVIDDVVKIKYNNETEELDITVMVWQYATY